MVLKALILKEIKLELRQKSVISGILIYLISLVFICYLSFSLGGGSLNEITWSALYWLTVLFSLVNSVGKSFLRDTKGHNLYMYQIAAPQQILAAKIIYNCILSSLMCLAAYLLFAILINNPVDNVIVFLLDLFLCSVAFSSILTIVSAIASKTNNSNVIMAILSFPVVIGILLMAIKITKNCIDGLEASASYDELWKLVAINFITLASGYLLFPFVWRS
jgi:heme exporter protein B